MKTIKKIKESSKAVAGSALLVGATLAGGAAFATASSHNMGGSSGSGDASLGDYPGHFIGEDGTVSSTVVMGEDAKAVDVVAGSAIAGQLGNNAFMTETETVETSGSGVGGGFSTTNGVTLDTANDDLFYGDTLDSIRDTLTQDNLDVLSETTFTDDSGDDTDVTNFLNIGNQPVQFGNGPDGIDDDEDPVLHVPVPAEGDVDDGTTTVDGVERDNYLFNLQANFEDGLDMTSEDVAGEDIELFGTTFTIAEENNVDSERNELVLYGSSETRSASTGDSTTVTIDGEEATLEVVGVTGDNTAAVRVNGDLEQLDEDEEVTVNGQDIRADNVIQTNSDNSQGTVQFSIGSQELVLQDGEQIEDGDGDDIEGTHVVFNGDGDDQFDFNSEEVSSIDLYVGAQDDDNDYVAAGETFTHDFLDQVEFQFAGLNPDAADSEGTTEVSVETNGDTEAQISFTADSGDSVSQDFIRNTDEEASDLDDTSLNLADSDGDDIVVREGATVEEDEYFTADAGDFAHMYEVTGIDRDATGDLEQGDEAFIDLRDVTTGNTREVDIDAVSTDGDVTEDGSSDGEFYAGTEIIDGQSYRFVVSGDEADDDAGSEDNLDTDGEPEFRFAYGDGSMIEVDEGINMGLYTGGLEMSGGATTLYSAVDTENNGALSFVGDTSLDANIETTGDVSEGLTVELPSTQSTDAKTLNIEHTQDATSGSPGTDDRVTLTTSDGASAAYNADASDDGATEELHVTVGSVDYVVTVSGLDGADNGDAGNDVTVDSVSLRDDQDSDDNFGTEASSPTVEDPTALFFQPEDDDDNENAFVLTPNGYDSDDGFSFSGSDAREYTGTIDAGLALEGTDDDTNAGYNEYGTYVETDTEDEGSVSLMVPNGQATAGAAFTGADGEISMTGGGGGSGTVETMTPTGFSNQYTALDSDSSISDARLNRHLILVGGPAVNDLVSELADENQTMAGPDYTEGQGMLQLVEDAFSEGHDALIVAGHSGEDTRAAGEFLVNHDENSDALEGSTQVTVNTAEGTVVQ